jgi:Phage integrase family
MVVTASSTSTEMASECNPLARFICFAQKPHRGEVCKYLNDLRHTFGSLLIQSGASIVYVKEQMGHSSIQVTVDTYGHLIPGANVSFVDKLDELATEKQETTLHQSAPGTHQAKNELGRELAEVADLIGGGGWTRTNDLRIMRPSL